MSGAYMKALIVDDELHAREEMKAMLEETCEIEVVGCCSNAIEALKAINRFKPDILFLDIQMPVIDGFELLNMVNQDIMPHVVFVTAYDKYSLKAFEEKTLDYLLKPVEQGRLAKTIEKLKSVIGTESTPTYETSEILRIPCLLGSRIKLVPIEDVQYISTSPAGVHVATTQDEFFTEVTLKVLEERTSLLRCHKQYLINLDAISDITLLDGGRGQIKTKSNRSIPISRRYLKILKQQLLI
jgi:two-component system, LytTR family, response regulator